MNEGKGFKGSETQTIGSHAVALPLADMSSPISVRCLVDHDALAMTGSGSKKVGRQLNEINRIIFKIWKESGGKAAGLTKLCTSAFGSRGT